MNKVVMVLALLLVLLSGCALLSPGDKTPDTEALMPDLPGYNTVEGETLTGYISNLAEGASMLAAQPELAGAVLAVDHIVGCYQDLGAIKARLYINKDEPLEAGTVAIADRNELLNPANFFKCVQPQLGNAVEIQPCTGKYTLEKDGNEFYIIYAGTTANICQTFCEHLEGCTTNK